MMLAEIKREKEIKRKGSDSKLVIKSGTSLLMAMGSPDLATLLILNKNNPISNMLTNKIRN